MFLHLHSSLATFQDNHKENSHATLEYPAVPHTVTDLCHCQFFICSPQVLSHGVNDLLLLLSGCCELLGSLVQGGDFPAIAFHVILQHLVPSREHSKADLPHCTVQLTRGMHTAVCFMVLWNHVWFAYVCLTQLELLFLIPSALLPSYSYTELTVSTFSWANNIKQPENM